MTLTVGSLFSGIGGLDLGLERAGMKVIWQSEIDNYASRVLKKHWPEVPNYGDIKDIKWGDIVRPDVICGGYPCQPFSTAGKRQGTDDPRHLWPWVREAISELRPDYAILENVRGHVSLGLNVVLGEMASIGYDAEWQIVSAASVGAPHRRDRVIILAYPSEQFSNERGHGRNSGEIAERQAVQESAGRSNSLTTRKVFTRDRWLNALMADTSEQYSDGEPNNSRDSAQSEAFPEFGDSSGTKNVANTDSAPREQQQEREVQESNFGGCSTNVANTKSNGLQSSSDMASIKNSQPRRGIARDDSGTRALGDWWATEPDVGRVANGVSSRVDRLRGLGNAVVPQVAELIGRMIIDFEEFR